MGLFSKNIKVLNSDLFVGMCDYHTHILPNVDDGVGSKEEALQILNYYENLGICRVFLTPHVMEDVPQDITDLRKRFEALRGEYRGNIKLSLSAEYMLDYSFFRLLEKGEMLTLFDNYLLVEMSYLQATMNIFECVESIMSKGYFVILAHPERYLYLSKADYKKLKNMGVLFQMNITSILGSYGDKVKQQAEHLLNESYYNLVGSDIHSLKYHSHVLKNSSLSEKYINKIKTIGSKHMGL